MHRPVKTFDHECGVSEIIGAIMLISVVVIAISVIGVFITSQGMPEKVPALSATISVSGDTITLHHDGGDQLLSSQLGFVVDGASLGPEVFTKNGQPWTTWAVGETLTASGLGETPGVVTVVYTVGSSSTVLSRADFTTGEGPFPPPVTTTVTPNPTTPVPTSTFSGIFPETGSSMGGTNVMIFGTGFNGATAVTFGGVAATTYTVLSATQISATTPPHASGAVDVIITIPGGAVTGTGAYTYLPAPTFSGISPETGSSVGGTSVTISGTGFTDATAVMFGGSAAMDLIVVSDTTITATTPAQSAGAVDLTITAPGGSVTEPGAFTYVGSPTFGEISPSPGSWQGGETVTITGTGFSGVTSVTIGGTSATTVSVNGEGTVITATTPAHAEGGAVDVVITTPHGSVTGVNAYRYFRIRSYLSGSTQWVVPNNVFIAEFLVVGGGGGGGYYGGGGGAGGLLTGALSVTQGTSITVTVGNGGSGATNNVVGGSGDPSVFGIITAYGGGGGGSSGSSASSTGASGASGGGGARIDYYGGKGLINQGNNGGSGYTNTNYYWGGGGGGASAAGANAANSLAGTGGTGASSSITGVSVTYAGGGGGGCRTGTAGSGGDGGGGNGGTNNVAGSDATGYGSGGGGGGRNRAGGDGSSGIVIIKYY